MEGTQKRKYIHAVHLTTSNKSLSGGVCKSPYYWKSKIRGKRGSELPFFFSHPFPEHLAMPIGTQMRRQLDQKVRNPHEFQPQLSVVSHSNVENNCSKSRDNSAQKGACIC